MLLSSYFVLRVITCVYSHLADGACGSHFPGCCWCRDFPRNSHSHVQFAMALQHNIIHPFNWHWARLYLPNGYNDERSLAQRGLVWTLWESCLWQHEPRVAHFLIEPITIMLTFSRNYSSFVILPSLLSSKQGVMWMQVLTSWHWASVAGVCWVYKRCNFSLSQIHCGPNTVWSQHVLSLFSSQNQ